MSFYDDASLVFLPSGEAGKDGKAYSMKPTNGNGDFTFSRGNNLSATRVDSNGLIEKGRENLLLQSNQFDTTWTTSAVGLTSGQSGYDGTNNAWLLTKTTIFSNIKQSLNQSNVCTFSVYAKANTYSWLLLHIEDSTGDAVVSFNLNDGSIGSQIQNIDASTESVGNGWYRCSITALKNVTEFRIYPNESNGYSGAAGSIYIQDAQVEQGLVATSYLESGATKATSGVADNEPRIDYAGGTASLLLEPSRTNLITQSEYLNSHTKNTSTLVNFSSVTCPIEGVKVSQIIDANTGSYGRLALFQTINLTASTTYTASVFAKADQLNFIYFSFDGASVNSEKRVWFNLSTGQVGTESGGATGSIESFGDGWYRCIMVFTADNTGVVNTKVAPAEVDNNINVDRDGSSSILATAMQLEEGSYPTSYIPTYGTSDTRAADDLNDLDISSMLTTSSFTWFLDLNDYIGSDINQQTIYLGGFVNIQLRVRPDGYRFYYNNIAGGSTYPIAGSTTANKFCVSYDGSNYRLYVDGVLQATTASVGDSGWDFIKNTTGASLPLKEMQLFPTALTDKEAVDLTSPYSTYQELVTAEGLTWESPTCTTNSITELQSI